MASRSEEVAIYLKTFGAASARRDIESVAKSLDKLDKKTGSHTRSTDDNTAATEGNAKARRASNDAIDEETGLTNKARRAKREYTTVLGMQSKILSDITKRSRAATRVDNQRQAELAKRGRAQLDQLKKNVNTTIKLENKKQSVLAAGGRRQLDQIKKNVATAIHLDTQRRRTLEANASSIMKIYDAAYKENDRRNRASHALAERLRRLEFRSIVAHNKAIDIEENKLAKLRKRRTKLITGLPKKLGGALSLPRARVVLITTAILAIADAIPIIGTALNAGLAGAIAIVNGLAPIAGLAGVFPGLILSMFQFGLAAKFIFGGRFFKALNGDKKALQGLHENAKKFIEEVGGLKQHFADLRNSLQGKFFKNLGTEVGQAAEKWMPLLNSRLGDTAKIFNKTAIAAFKWLRSLSGVVLLSRIMGQNNKLISVGLQAIGQFAQVFLHLGDSAGPVLSMMFKDLLRLGKFLNLKTYINRNALANYFIRAYESAKRAGRIIGRFMIGLHTIFKLSAPLSKHLADNINAASKHFLKWTRQKKHIQQIKDYFAEMTPNLDAIGRLAETLVKAIFRLSRSKNFQQIVADINDLLVPALLRIIESLDGNFIGLLVQMIDNIAKLANPATMKVLFDLSGAFVSIITAITDWYASLSPGTQKVLVWAIAIGAIFGGLATTIIGAVARIIGSILSIGKQKGVINALRGGGAAGVVGGGGAGGGSAIVGGGSKKAKPAAPRRANQTRPLGGQKTAKPRRAMPKTPKGPSMGGTLAGTAAATIGVLALGPITDAATGASKAFQDLDGKAHTALSTLATKSVPAGQALSGMFGPNWEHGWTTFEGALKQVADPSGIQKFNQATDSINSAVTGTTTPLSKAQAEFTALDTQLTTMPADQAATAFKKIRDKAHDLGVPVDNLVGLFPQYRDKVKGVVNPTNDANGAMNNAGSSAYYMAHGLSAINSAVNNFNTTKLAAINGATTGKRVFQVKFAGGTLGAGELSSVGELGPEFGITRGGQISLLGGNGPEFIRSQQQMAVIPASATSDPIHGNYGNAPDWARMALQSAVKSSGTNGRLPINAGRREDSGASNYKVEIGQLSVGSSQDIESIKGVLIDAMRKMERDKRERK